MFRIVIGMFLTAAAFAQTPAERALKLNTLGNQTSDAGDYTGAARSYREAIEIWRSLGEGYEAHLAGSLMNLATVLCGDGHRVEGASFFEESLALHRRTLGTHHLRTLHNMNLLATDYLMLGEVDKAETLVNEAFPIIRAEYPGDIQAARSLEVVSGILNRHGKLREALAPAEEALAITIKVAGEDSLESALAYASTAEAHRAAGQPDRALPLYRKSHALYEKFLGPNHPRVASLLSQEGVIALQEGKLATAEQLMVRAVSILKESCPGCVVELAIAENNLGLLRLRQKRYRDADEVLSHSLALREKFSPRPSKELATTLQTLAVARKMQHRDADADSLAKRAASIMSFQ